jgi:hypothetical protein
MTNNTKKQPNVTCVCPPAHPPFQLSTKINRNLNQITTIILVKQQEMMVSKFIRNYTFDGTKTSSTSMSFILKFLLLLIISIRFESTLSFDDFLDQEDASCSLHEEQQQLPSTLNPPTLPPLISYVEYGQVCYPDGLLFKAYCNT